MREKLGVLSVMESSTPINKCDLNSVVTMPCLLCGEIYKLPAGRGRSGNPPVV